MVKIRNKKFAIVIILAILLPSISVFLINSQNYTQEIKTNNTKIYTSAEIIHDDEPWLNNSNFNSDSHWFSSKEGDITDTEAYISNGQANFNITGDKRTFSNISGIPTSEIWENVTNPAFPILPDYYGIDQYGCEANHTWIDPTDPEQAPSVHWERIITMPVNMSDYVITSASISTIYNASVTTSPGGASSPQPYYGVDSRDDPVDQPGDYDSARFYVLISDLGGSETYEIAWYQTVHLGQDSPEISNITDSFMEKVVEESLIFYLTSLFERDSFHFKVILGIRIKCIDNFNYDRDRWDSLRIKSCDLNFTYEKKIDQFTKISWNQEGESLSGENIQITDANLRFRYKVDQPWPTSSSPTSEIKVLLNGNSHEETIRLSLANETFKDAKLGGFDVTTLILLNIEIQASIQIYIANEFLLNRTITISIDDVYLDISYIEITTVPLGEPEIFRLLLILAAVAGGLLGSYLILYQRIFKYPLPVRKVRKYRRTLKNSEGPKRSITTQDAAFKKVYGKEIGKSTSLLKSKSPQKTAGGKIEKISEISKPDSSGGET
ncbi:MAG: hypothetical protein KGD74_06450 [Candidatus Lokiarchaeota archaeon]|nr:hypothetical protein [Candidatus Lokiarchaeota archaeon]